MIAFLRRNPQLFVPVVVLLSPFYLAAFRWCIEYNGMHLSDDAILLVSLSSAIVSFIAFGVSRGCL